MFRLEQSLERARRRLGRSSRRRRSDAGRSRLPAVAQAALRSAALEHDRPAMSRLQHRVAAACARRGARAPSRASIYNALATLPGHTYAIATLPPEARHALHNLAEDASVPGHQLAFACFNHGSLAAVCFASGLPWLDLYQAARLRGWRPRSRGLLVAVMRARGLR